MIQRHFIRIGDRHVHFRSAGHGPPLLLLHQSPQNSRMWLDMIVRFADRYTVIAPDTPGFGYSDPLSMEAPGIADFADATFEFADALGLERFALFGMHTGGLIGMHAAWTRPQRLSCLIVDGYALFNNEERSNYTESYLPPFVPGWDGAHLRWLWSRMREQVYFFPDFSFLTVNVAAVPLAVNFELPALQVAVALVIAEPPKLCATQVTLAFEPLRTTCVSFGATGAVASGISTIA